MMSCNPFNSLTPPIVGTAIVKNKSYTQSGRLRVNMGNIYFEQKKYSSAIKMYRMALDQVRELVWDIRHGGAFRPGPPLHPSECFSS